MGDIIFEDFTMKVLNAIADKANQALEEAASEIESEAKRNTRVASGQTKNNWQHFVDDVQHEATIGNPMENAIWEEFGTGEYAVNGDGRKGGWTYQDEKGEFHHTHGKKPTRALQRAFDSKKKEAISHIQNVMKGL